MLPGKSQQTHQNTRAANGTQWCVSVWSTAATVAGRAADVVTATAAAAVGEKYERGMTQMFFDGFLFEWMQCVNLLGIYYELSMKTMA